MATRKYNTKTTREEPIKTQPTSGYDFNKLTRSTTDKVIGGVCAGLAQFFNIDTTLVRLIFIFLVVFGGGGILLYLILWIVLPADNSKLGITEEGIRLNAEEMKQRARTFAGYFGEESKQENSRKLFGLIVLALGVLLLLQNFGMFSFQWIGRLWPLVLIVIAFSILTNDRHKR